jgi:hypothetical protein
VFITPEVLDLNCGGLAREQTIYDAAMPNLESIPHPRLPLDPCPMEDWKHRCGCKKCKKGGHDGPCQACPPDSLPPTSVYELPPVNSEILPPVPALPQDDGTAGPTLSPAASPFIEPRESDVPQVPVAPEPRLQPRLEQPNNSRQLQPVQVESAAKKLPSPPVFAESPKAPPRIESPVIVRIPEPPPATIVSVSPPFRTPLKRLPVIAEEPPALAARLTPRDIFRPLPPVERAPAIASTRPTKPDTFKPLPPTEQEPVLTASRHERRDAIRALPAIEGTKLR